jgi:hypothetical protein
MGPGFYALVKGMDRGSKGSAPLDTWYDAGPINAYERQ